MDIGELRLVTTILLMLVFAGIVWWAYGKGRKSYFDEAAAIPFTEEDEPGAIGQAGVRADKRKES